MTREAPATRRGAPSARPLAALCLIALVAFAGVAPGSALELTDGKLRLTLSEGTGRFSLAWQSNAGRFVSLLSSEDPRTSMLRILVGNRVYTMGDSPEFMETAEKMVGGARFVWRSPFLQVTETFTFVASTDTPATSGVQIRLSLKNLSAQDASIGVCYLFDTWLGEASFVHFRTDVLKQVTHEMALLPADKAPWWVSPLPDDPDGIGFQVMLSGPGVTPPDRVVFANWKRLTDSPWAYDVSTVRTFSVLPYSVNDSAAGQYYNPQTVSGGEELTIGLVLGKFSAGGFAATSLEPPAAVVTPPAPAAPAPAPAPVKQDQAVLADLASVNAILNEIDAALASGKPLSAERLATIQELLKQLSDKTPAATGGSDAGK